MCETFCVTLCWSFLNKRTCVSFFLQAPKKPTVKKESKEKRESNEESKENLKAKSDDSGEEKNGDDDSQKNGPKKKGEYDKTPSRSM